MHWLGTGKQDACLKTVEAIKQTTPSVSWRCPAHPSNAQRKAVRRPQRSSRAHVQNPMSRKLIANYLYVKRLEEQLSVCLPVPLSACLSVCLFARLSLCLSALLFVCPFDWMLMPMFGTLSWLAASQARSAICNCWAHNYEANVSSARGPRTARLNTKQCDRRGNGG